MNKFNKPLAAIAVLVTGTGVFAADGFTPVNVCERGDQEARTVFIQSQDEAVLKAVSDQSAQGHCWVRLASGNGYQYSLVKMQRADAHTNVYEVSVAGKAVGKVTRDLSTTPAEFVKDATTRDGLVVNAGFSPASNLTVYSIKYPDGTYATVREAGKTESAKLGDTVSVGYVALDDSTYSLYLRK
jgi:hypothetical protein